MRILFLLLSLAVACENAVFAGAVESVVAAENEGIPYKQDKAADHVSVSRIFIILVFLLAVAAGAAYLIKKSPLGEKLGVTESKYIKLVEAKRISPKLGLYLVRVHDRHYLLAQSGDKLSLIEHKAAGGAQDDV